MIGKVILHYRIVEKLGEGGMGVVYKAHDTKLHRTVAVKSLSERFPPASDDQARLVAEARAAAAINHPGICSVIDILDHEGRKFIVMEFVEGESLRTKLRVGRIATEELVDYAVQIADALAEAHRRGVVHRDIKPENIVISPAGRVKIMDFGIARRSGSTRLTRDAAVLGTTAYMSPEQARGEVVDARTDVWSFGAVLYEASTGTLPFASDYEQAVIYGILNQTPKSARTLNSLLPEALDAVILRCLAKAPDDRYPTMQECLSQLKAIDSPRTTEKSFSGTLKVKRTPVIFSFILAAGLAVGLAAASLFWPETKRVETRPSVAVLPFENLGDREEDAFFAEGLTEDIISQLGSVPELKVIGRSSMMRYKDTEKTYREIGTELGVAALLEGSVRHVGGRVRIVARLVDHANGEDLWNNTYDRNLQDILAIQIDIATRISTALRVQIQTDIESTRGKPFNYPAWRLYQQGKSEYYRRSIDGTRAAIEFFEEAMQLDPDFALAHAGLADAFLLLGDTGILAIRPAQAFEKAKQEALRAIALDGHLAEGHASLGHVQIHQFEWDRAEQSLRQAVDLNPSSALSQAWLGLHCLCVGRKKEALQRVENALLVDPFSIIITQTAAAVYYRLGLNDSAKTILNRMLRIEPSSPRLHFILGKTYASMGLHQEALGEFRVARALENNTEVRAAMAQALGLLGHTTEALTIVDSLIENREHEFVDPVRLAEVYACLGRKDDAFKWLERALAEESAGIIFLKADPWYNDLRSEQRFISILRKIGLN